jgi:hypothetical protein
MKNELIKIFPHISIPTFTEENCEVPFCCDVTQERLRKEMFYDAKTNIFISNHPRTIEVFGKYKNGLLDQEFQFSSCLTVQVQEFFDKLRQKHVQHEKNEPMTFVAIHARRTNYEKFLQEHDPHGGNYLSKQFYVTAMNYFRYTCA